MTSLEWSKEAPTKAGNYWFHGWHQLIIPSPRWGKPKTYLVKVRNAAMIGDDVSIYFNIGDAVTAADRFDGKWAKATLPEPPSMEDDA